MADCMFHGPTPPGPCPYCQEEERRGMKEGELNVDADVFKANMQMKQNEFERRKSKENK